MTIRIKEQTVTKYIKESGLLVWPNSPKALETRFKYLQTDIPIVAVGFIAHLLDVVGFEIIGADHDDDASTNPDDESREHLLTLRVAQKNAEESQNNPVATIVIQASSAEEIEDFKNDLTLLIGL